MRSIFAPALTLSWFQVSGVLFIEAADNPRPVHQLCHQTQYPKQDHHLESPRGPTPPIAPRWSAILSGSGGAGTRGDSAMGSWMPGRTFNRSLVASVVFRSSFATMLTPGQTNGIWRSS